MATTTNYGWTTPNDTDLVKDGASAIRTLGSAIDTTTKNLNPSTTLGDIEYRSATANTNTRLALGTAGQVLTVNSGATAPEWQTPTSGSLTLLSTTSLSGATTTISAISGAYTHLFLSIYGVTNATADGSMRIAPNGTTNITTNFRNTSGTGFVSTSDDYLFLNAAVLDVRRTNANNVWSLFIYNYANTTYYKSFSNSGVYYYSNDTTEVPMLSAGAIITNSAITSLVFSNSGGNLSTGTVLLYGVK